MDERSAKKHSFILLYWRFSERHLMENYDLERVTQVDSMWPRGSLHLWTNTPAGVRER